MFHSLIAVDVFRKTPDHVWGFSSLNVWDISQSLLPSLNQTHKL